MDAGPRDRVSLMVLRAWAEDDGEHARLRMRVRVTAVDDVSAARPQQKTTVVADVEQVCELVRAWLIAYETGRQDM